MEPEVLLLTSDEVAEILRVSKRTLQNYRTEAKLPYYQISRKIIRYRANDVIQFLQNSSSCGYQKDSYKKLLKQYLVRL